MYLFQGRNTDERTTYLHPYCGTKNLRFQNRTGCDVGFRFKMLEDIYQQYYLFWYWEIHRISCSLYENYSLSFAILISMINKVIYTYDPISYWQYDWKEFSFAFTKWITTVNVISKPIYSNNTIVLVVNRKAIRLCSEFSSGLRIITLSLAAYIS